MQSVDTSQQIQSAGTSAAGSANPGAASALDALGVSLRQEFDEAERLRKTREDEWLKDLRQFKGIYDPEVMARIHKKRSKVFIRLTRAKVRSTDARMAKLLFPAGDRNYSVDRTPVVELDPNVHLTALAEVMQKLGLMDPRMLPPEKALEAVNEIATKRMQGMQTEIDDQLTEGNYKAESRKVLHSGHLYGTGILKGPLVERRERRQWQPSKQEEGKPAPTSSFSLGSLEVKTPGFSMRPVWAIYPDPFATDVKECQYIWDRHVLNKHELLQTARRNRFDMAIVNLHVRINAAGDARQRHWETDLITLGDREQAGAPKNRYELLERWGYVYGKDLAGAGLMDATKMSDEEMAQEYESRLFLLGNRVVKVSLNPLPSKTKPFHFYYFDKDDSSIWGNSIPSIYRDSQTSFNSAIRVTIDNAAISGGPQVEVNRDLMEDEEDVEDIHPFRIWVRTGTGQEAQAPALRVYEIASHVEQNMQMAKMFKDIGDEAVTIPSFTYGEASAGVAKTVGGLSMLMGQANITIEEPARNWDEGVTEPFITGMYDWNMKFGTKEEIKGDYMVKARGASALVAKELRQNALQGFQQATANPMDAPYTKRGYLLRESAKALDLEPDKAVITEQEEQKMIELGVIPGIPAGGVGGMGGGMPGGPGSGPAAAGLPPGGAAQVLGQ